MTYVPRPQIAAMGDPEVIESRDLAFMVEAWKQSMRVFCAEWNLPGIHVAAYAWNTYIPSKEAALLGLVQNDFNDDAAGLHNVYADQVGGLVDMHQSSGPSRTGDHENKEIGANSFLDRWAPGPQGLAYAMEVSDPCQRDSYHVEVELFGERRTVELSNHVLPSWFDENGSPPYDHLGLIKKPFELRPGGYQIARDGTGQIRQLSHADGAFLNSMHTRRHARTRRLIESGRKA